jgi:hypothetical protein
MAQETLKITITADNKDAVNNINQTITATNNLGNAFRQIPQTSGAATNALTNLSRVAQDAPYGFIGIANNLNPLLESFQRLKVEAGSTSGALKSMASGLMGPAGIGLALGAVSSLIVAFGPKIANFIKGVDAAKEAEDKFAESLNKAKASASESGIKLQAYINLADDVTLADNKRANALKFVISELSKVNASYAATIKTTDQARQAVELYTQALIAQAITSRYVDEIADKTIKLADANKRAIAAAEEYNKTIERSKTMTNGYVDASVAQASSISKAKSNYVEAAQEAVNLNNSIQSLNQSLMDTVRNAATNPFNNVTNGAKQLGSAAEKATQGVEKLGKQARVIKVGMATVVEQPNVTPTAGTPTKLQKDVPAWASTQVADAEYAAIQRQKEFNAQLSLTRDITNTLAPAFDNVISAMVMGEDIGKALEQSFKQIVVQLISMIAQALLFKTILAAITGGTSEIAGAASGLGGGMGGLGSILGEFVLKGSDLVLATTRANNNLNIRRGN